MTLLPSPADPHEWRVRVYYEDTDAAGIVYYANYLKFAERARTELLRQGGIDQSKFAADHGLVFAVKNCTIEYDSPARLDDVLTIRTVVRTIAGASLDLAQNIWRDGEARPLARLSVRIVCLKAATGKPERIPGDLKGLFAAHLAGGKNG